MQDYQTIVFTGFRNEEWENIIENNGGKINNTISKNTDSEKQSLDTSSLVSKLGKINAQNDNLLAQNPLFSILTPAFAYNEKGVMQYGKGCIIGTAKIVDTAKINDYLSQPEIRLLFPKYTKLLWMFKPASHIGSEMLEMVAVKTNRRGVADVSGAHITNARIIFHDESSSPSISIVMNLEGAFAWKRLSRKNVGWSIAIVVDDQVYSCPVVNAEIPNGNTSLDGGFTLEEATDFANVLNAGKLPVRLRILTEETVLPMSSR